MLEQGIIVTDCREDNSDEAAFFPLIDVLKKELTIYQELKDFIAGEKKILIKPSLDQLNESNAHKENIILKARMLEEARTNILKKIARNLGLKEAEIKLTTLIVYAAVEQRRELEEISREIASVAGEIRRANEMNKDLLDPSLSNVKASLDFICSLTSQGPVYLPSGKIRSLQSNGKFLRTEG